jgi:predicted nucleic acid-binding protein
VSLIVVDASVALKWFIPEVHSADARQWRNSLHELHTLAIFFDIEVANTLWKKIQRSELSGADAAQILALLPVLPLARYPEGPLLPSALIIASQLQRTVYDSLYLALAVELDGRMVTADQRLYNSVSATSLANRIVWVADFVSVP